MPDTMECFSRKRLSRLIAAALTVAACARGILCPAADATEASHVRGPAYDGHFDDANVSLPWPSSGPRVVWRKRIAEGLSGLVIAEGRVFTQIQTLAGQCVVCLDVETGRERWRTRYNWPWQPEGNWPGPYGSPTYQDGRVFFTDCFGGVGCVDATHGRLLWRVDLTKEPGVVIPEFGYAATPLVHDDTVYLPVGGTNAAVMALRATDGAVRWKRGDAPGGYSSCVWLQVRGQPQVVAFLDGVALGLDPDSGAELWRHGWASETTPNATWPLYEEPLLFHSLPFHRGGRTLRLAAGGSTRSADIVWNKKVLSMEILPGVVVQGQVYGFDLRDFEAASDGITRGVFKCVDLVTGRERWRTDRVGQCTVLACGERLLLLSERGALIVAEADPAGYRELARCALFTDQRCWSPPAIARNLLVARSRQDFVCVDLASRSDSPAAVGVGSADHGAITSRCWNRVAAWFGGRYGKCFYAPTLAEQSRWLTACLLGVLLPAWLLACRFRAGAPRQTAFTLATLALGLAGTWVGTQATGRFLFTWPTALFGALHLTLSCRVWAIRAATIRHLLLARLCLIGFAFLTVGYWFACRSLFFVVGGGYLVGLLPALPLFVAAAGVASNPTYSSSLWRTPLLLGLTFTVQFASSALFILWRT